MLKDISVEVKPYMKQGVDAKKHGKVLVGTVKGDIHDIAKDIVVFMLDVNGFEVKDLGVDVPMQKFVDATKEFQPDIVALSGFLTLAYGSMKDTIAALKDAGLRDIRQDHDRRRHHRRAGLPVCRRRCLRHRCHHRGQAGQEVERSGLRWLNIPGKTPISASRLKCCLPERSKRLKDAIEMRQPDRVPISLGFSYMIAEFGGITKQEMHENPEKSQEILEKAAQYFQPDGASGGAFFSTPEISEILGDRMIRFPGHGIGENDAFQFAEDEYMKPEDYDDYLFDPADWGIRKLLPAVCIQSQRVWQNWATWG